MRVSDASSMSVIVRIRVRHICVLKIRHKQMKNWEEYLTEIVTSLFTIVYGSYVPYKKIRFLHIMLPAICQIWMRVRRDLYLLIRRKSLQHKILRCMTLVLCMIWYDIKCSVEQPFNPWEWLTSDFSLQYHPWMKQ